MDIITSIQDIKLSKERKKELKALLKSYKTWCKTFYGNSRHFSLDEKFLLEISAKENLLKDSPSIASDFLNRCLFLAGYDYARSIYG